MTTGVPNGCHSVADARRTNGLLQEALSDRVWESTVAADGELTKLVRGLYPDWARWRKARNAALEASA